MAITSLYIPYKLIVAHRSLSAGINLLIFIIVMDVNIIYASQKVSMNTKHYIATLTRIFTIIHSSVSQIGLCPFFVLSSMEGVKTKEPMNPNKPQVLRSLKQFNSN